MSKGQKGEPVTERNSTHQLGSSAPVVTADNRHKCLTNPLFIMSIFAQLNVSANQQENTNGNAQNFDFLYVLSTQQLSSITGGNTGGSGGNTGGGSGGSNGGGSGGSSGGVPPIDPDPHGGG
ncbi:MAG: hypothetical protein AAFQ98_04405 [Bacteroidota bacterium]